MILQVWRYAYGGAKIMALKSYLLTPQDYHFLLRARNLEDLLGFLRTTAYGPVLAGWDWRVAGAETELSRLLFGDLAQAFFKVGRGLKQRERRFLEVLAGRLVAENLKVVLRALHQGVPPDQAAGRLLPLKKLTPLNFPAMLQQRTIPELAAYLAPTPWGAPLNRGLPRFLREQNLFPLEMSLDLWVFDYLWEGLKHLSRADRKIAGQLLGTMADITNIVWAGRFRDIYGFPGEETYQYLIAAGSFRRPRDRRALAFAVSVADMLPHLPLRAYQVLLQGAAEGTEVEARLMHHWLATLERILRRPPFQIGLPMTYLFLKELELHNLITLITGELLNLPAEAIAPLLQRRGAGG